MKRSSPVPGGDLEYAVLAALWELGVATIRDVHERVGMPNGLVYTTIAKVVDRLFAKGLVSREELGKTFRYRARGDRAAVERRRARVSLEHLFGDAPQPGIATLVDAVEAIDPALLDELARVVNARRRKRRGS